MHGRLLCNQICSWAQIWHATASQLRPGIVWHLFSFSQTARLKIARERAANVNKQKIRTTPGQILIAAPLLSRSLNLSTQAPACFFFSSKHFFFLLPLSLAGQESAATRQLNCRDSDKRLAGHETRPDWNERTGWVKLIVQTSCY